MSDITLEILKLIIMVAVLVVTRYLIPWMKTKIDSEKLNQIAEWAAKAVLKVQQVYWSKDGAERKAIVTQFLKEILTAKNISISDEQLDTLIEAAVKQMKIEENAGVKIETTNNITKTETASETDKYKNSSMEV